MALKLKEIIRITPKENLSIATFMIKDYLNRGELSYIDFLECEKLIKLYSN